MRAVTVTTQAELNKMLARRDAGLTIVVDSPADEQLKVEDTPSLVIARGYSALTVRGSTRCVARELACIVARDEVQIVAYNSVSVETWDDARLDAWGQAYVAAYDRSHVETWGHRVRAYRCSDLATVVRRS